MPSKSPRNRGATPRYWTRRPGSSGGLHLAFAVRGGTTHAAIVVLGLGLVCAGAYAYDWLVRGGGLTPAGWIFALLVPGSAIAAGLYCLDRMLWASEICELGPRQLSLRKKSLFGGGRQEVPRRAIRAIYQQYTPPPASSSASHPGEWVSFVRWQRDGEPDFRDLPVGGLHTVEERDWLGPLLAEWAGVPLTRGAAPSAEEAETDDLPDD